jgi:hypothetical protein
MMVQDQNLTYLNCVICGHQWSSLEGETLREHKTMWCCNAHDTLWYYQDADGTCSFDLEVDNLHGSDYQVRWNCQCMDEECRGKNIIISVDVDDSEIVKEFDQPIPYNISRDELYKLITG